MTTLQPAHMTTLQPAQAAGFAACPLCHTTDDVLTGEALAAGGDWHCRTCGQAWTAARLATAESYSAWVLARLASA